MGVGDWGLGIVDWELGIGPNPQSPIPNPQSPIPKKLYHPIINKILINIYISYKSYNCLMLYKK